MSDEVLLNLPMLNECGACHLQIGHTFTFRVMVDWRRRTIQGGELVGKSQWAHNCGPNSNIGQIIEKGA